MASDPPSADEGTSPGKPPKERRKAEFEARPVTRGLPSVAQARADRRRMRWLPPRFWAWATVFIGAGIIVWWKLDDGEIHRMRSDLLARQRAVVAELGPRWFPMREKLERWTTECSVGAFVDETNPNLVKEWDFRAMPGIYLRLSEAAAKDPKTIREAAKKSLKDGFTTCLLQVSNPSPLAGKACENTADCPPKNVCNEFNHCAEPTQPYNLRLAYRALYMMSDEWVGEIQAIGNKLTMRGAIATFDAANKYDLPMATDLLQRSKYFLVVVDEQGDGMADSMDAALPEADAGREDDRSIPTAPHPARVCVWRLEDDKKMIAVRRDAAGELVGPAAGMDEKTRIAHRRQANACALALSVREAMGAEAGAQVLPEDEPPPVPSGSAAPSAAPSSSSSGG